MPSDALPDDLQTLKAMLLAERCESERLRQIIKELQRHRFGRRAETLPEDQMLLGLEDVEQVEASGEAKQDANAPEVRATRAHKRRVNRGSLPAHLPTQESSIFRGSARSLILSARCCSSTWRILPGSSRVVSIRARFHTRNS